MYYVHNFATIKTPLMFCQNKVGSKDVLLTNATKLYVSDIMSHAWFYTATSISHFSGSEWDGRCWHFPSHFKPERHIHLITAAANCEYVSILQGEAK